MRGALPVTGRIRRDIHKLHLATRTIVVQDDEYVYQTGSTFSICHLKTHQTLHRHQRVLWVTLTDRTEEHFA